MPDNMRREFANREELTQYLREQFPEAEQPHQLSPIIGGRRAAVARLDSIDPVKYASSRNFLDGAVTRLSPYLRHGVLSLAQVRDFALSRVRHKNDAAKFINELGWRDYWQRVRHREGNGIWNDLEDYKTGYLPDSYATELPDDIQDAATGMVCVDSWIEELYQTGYLHNHARMWLAAYVVHWRRVRWQAGARWFLVHLLDGDPASNNLSWQWVASTFAHKPYFFNRENVEKYSAGVFCSDCPQRGRCDFEGSYDKLERQLFALPLADNRSTPYRPKKGHRR